MRINPGATDVSLYFMLRDDATRAPKTGITITDIDLVYIRFGAAAAAKGDATALGAVDAAHADNKAIEVAGTYYEGMYRVDFPDAAFAAGADGVILTVVCAGCEDAHMEVELTEPEVNVTKIDGSAVQQAGGYLKVTDASGNAIASSAALAVLSSALIKVSTTVDVGINSTSAALVDATGVEVGDVLVWQESDIGGPPFLTDVTAVDGLEVTWSPALAITPDNGDSVTALPGVVYRTLQSLDVPASPTAGSISERIKAIGDKLPSGDIADQTTLEIARKLIKNKLTIDITNSKAVLYDDDGSTPLYEAALTDDDGAAITTATTGPINRGPWTTPA